MNQCDINKDTCDWHILAGNNKRISLNRQVYISIPISILSGRLLFPILHTSVALMI